MSSLFLMLIILQHVVFISHVNHSTTCRLHFCCWSFYNMSSSFLMLIILQHVFFISHVNHSTTCRLHFSCWSFYNMSSSFLLLIILQHVVFISHVNHSTTCRLHFSCWSFYNMSSSFLLLSAPLRLNGADYVLLLFIFFIFVFYSPFVLRNYATDSHQIFRNCVFWCSLNNLVVLKFFWRHFAEKNAKNS